jgi:deoxyribose-phosphate aldolase
MTGLPVTREQLAKVLDSTLLKPEAALEDVVSRCKEAITLHTMAVAISPIWVPVANEVLSNSEVRVCAAIGFPSGAHSAAVKAVEAELAVDQGATEIDMVISIGKVKSGNFEAIHQEVAAVRSVAGYPITVKVILETAALTSAEIQSAGEASIAAGADFLKTSTGFGPGGATIEAVDQLASIAHSAGRFVKASGGIKDTRKALAMLAAGADRIGTSSAKEIVDGFSPGASAT